MKKRKITLSILLTVPFLITAQASRGANGFPELTFASIAGAPLLSRPVLITSGTDPIVSRGFGYAAPAYYDWDNDGIKDLLIGEYASGTENGRAVGSFVRVYLNSGTETQPSFTGKFDYARVPFEYQVEAHGTPYSVDQYCCIGFTPQFIDLDSDGYLDMITGQYQGEVSWFRGSKEGFRAGSVLPQDGNPRGKDWVKYQPYWLYSAASFGDFTNDGKPDLIVGGQALRISINIGTTDQPQFAHREPLLNEEGKPLKVYEYSKEELDEISKLEYFNTPYPAGDYATSPYVVDWDEDGVLDLMVTNSYSHKGFEAVTFFRGVKKDTAYRFEKGIPLFTVKDGSKAFPGSSPFVFVTDWNNDGVKDLLLGSSIVMLHDSFSDLSWTWNKEANVPGPGKGPSTLKRLYTEEQFRLNIMAHETPPAGISMEDFLTLDHRGYVYVLLGTKAIPTKPIKAKKAKTK